MSFLKVTNRPIFSKTPIFRGGLALVRTYVS